MRHVEILSAPSMPSVGYLETMSSRRVRHLSSWVSWVPDSLLPVVLGNGAGVALLLPRVIDLSVPDQ